MSARSMGSVDRLLAGLLFICLASSGAGFAACAADAEATGGGADAAAADETPMTEALPCPASGVSKGPWAIGMTRTSVIVRWEACRAGATPGLVYRADVATGAEVSVPTIERPFVLTQRHTAVLGPERSPDDLPGTVYMHEAAVTGLTAGTCYRYALAADKTLDGRFCTSQPDGGRLHFLVIGDTNPLLGDTTGKLIGTMIPRGADFIVHGGDIEYYDSHLETWTGWFKVMRPLLALATMEPALGNHEHETPDELDEYSLRYFGHPNFGGATMWYSFESGGVWFHVLDTEQPIEPTTPQGLWLTASLADAAQKPGFRGSILVMHRPLVTCGDSDQKDVARKAYATTLAQYKVPFVIQAHMHGYERFLIDGVTYITSGGGGGLVKNPNENAARPECAMRQAWGGFFHAVDIVIEGKELRGMAIDESGATRDSFTVTMP